MGLLRDQLSVAQGFRTQQPRLRLRLKHGHVFSTSRQWRDFDNSTSSTRNLPAFNVRFNHRDPGHAINIHPLRCLHSISLTNHHHVSMAKLGLSLRLTPFRYPKYPRG